MEVVRKRGAAYDIITKMMDDLRCPSSTVTPNQRVRTERGGGTVESAAMFQDVEIDEIMNAVLKSEDELAHVGLFR